MELDQDYDGVYDETLATHDFAADFPSIGLHIAKLRVTDSSGRSATTLARITVVEADDEPDDDGSAAALFARGGGCGCRLAHPAQRHVGAWLAALLLGAAWRRRSQRFS